ncbi:MAG: agmatine deiminase [Eubacteriales bacterium]|nr:agmatine deiminase [Eubacteriales bacterium]
MELQKSEKWYPADEGYRMPGEFEPHEGCVLVWPSRPGSWTNGGREAKPVFAMIARAIARSEKVWMLSDADHLEECRREFSGDSEIQVLPIDTDDAWARDIGPTGIVGESGEVRGIDWRFNAWGGDYDGLYANWEKDDKAAEAICRAIGIEPVDARHLVLEGGSIHSDGEGTLMVTETCLLSPGRNPNLTKEQIEEELKCYLGVQKVLWLPRGIAGDETNEHVDNVCAFVRPGEVVLAWTEDPSDMQWGPSHECLAYLEKERDAKGRALTIHKLPIPKNPVRITKEELSALIFEEGEDQREEGERLAASYVNFYISNGGIILPFFGDENDEVAAEILRGLFPERKIYPIPARPIIVGGGNIHCITQQIPRRKQL